MSLTSNHNLPCCFKIEYNLYLIKSVKADYAAAYGISRFEYYDRN